MIIEVSILMKEVMKMWEWFDFDIDDWMVIGPLSEELADDEKERRKIEKDYFDDCSDEDDDFV